MILSFPRADNFPCNTWFSKSGVMSVCSPIRGYTILSPARTYPVTEGSSNPKCIFSKNFFGRILKRNFFPSQITFEKHFLCGSQVRNAVSFSFFFLNALILSQNRANVHFIFSAIVLTFSHHRSIRLFDSESA